MLKIRVSGTPEDLRRASEILQRDFRILAESEIMPNMHGSPDFSRIYFDAALRRKSKEREEPDDRIT